MLQTEENSVCSAQDVAQLLKRMAFEIVERNLVSEKLVLVGILTRGVSLARRLQKISNVGSIEPEGILKA